MITGEMKNKVASAHDIPSKCCYFIDKAGSSLLPALKLFCSICTTIQRLHRIWD